VSWKLRIAAVMVLVSLSACAWYWIDSQPRDITLSNGARISWVRCWFDVPWWRSVDCAHVYTRNAPGEVAPARLAVVVIRDRSWKHHPDPVIYLSGGPGGPAWIDAAGIDFWFGWLDDAQLGRDLVLYDVRGVGMSEPRLSCPQLLEFYRAELGIDREHKDSLERQRAAALECKQSLLAAGHRLQDYSTAQNVHDLQDVMATIGYTQWNIYAVSYGTRLAMRAAQADAEGLRSLLLDSVYPPDKNDPALWPALANDAFQRLFDGCRSHTGCARNYPDLESQFRQALARLDAQPLAVSIEHWQSGEHFDVVVNQDRLFVALFEAMYSWELIEQLPRAIAEVTQGHGTALQPIIEAHVNFLLDSDFSDAVFLSVECADSLTITRERYLAEAARYPLLYELVRDDWDFDVCRDWHGASTTNGIAAPAPIEPPALLLSGHFDPVTPPDWAESALPQFAHAHHFSFAAVGHDVLGSDDCSLRLWGVFLERPDARPNHGCLDEPAPVQFHVGRQTPIAPPEVPTHRVYQ